MNDIKIHTDISVQDKKNDVTVYSPDPQVRERYESFVQYVRELELRMRGYGKQEDVIDGLIAKYECYDKTNDDEDRSVLKDLSGNGHDIQLYNFAFAENSGFGLYGTNFNDWYVDTQQSDVSRTSTSFIITARDTDSLVSSSCRLVSNTTSFTFKFKIVRSDATNIDLNIYNYPTDGSATVTETAISNIQVGQVYSYTFEDMPSNYARRNIYFYPKYAKYFEVELIPDYKGALVSDGVDDYGLCENFPILTKEKGYTVVALRELLEVPNGELKITLSSSFAYIERLEAAKIYNTYSYLTSSNINDVLNSNWFYQTSNKYNGKTIKKGETITNDKFQLFRLNTDYTKIALYALEIYDRDLTDEEIAKVKERMIKQYEAKTGETYVEEVTA